MRSRITLTAVLLWGASLAVGYWWLIAYQSTPGPATDAAVQWPAEEAFEPGRPNLVLVAHPRCPCTRATLAELSRVLTRCPGQAAVQVIFVRPSGLEPGWEKTDLWHSAEGMPGVRVRCTADGSVARSFGAVTSGHVLLYSADGRLQFSGGITAGRGHEGDNPGSRALIDLLGGTRKNASSTRVYGCELSTPCPACAEGASWDN